MYCLHGKKIKLFLAFVTIFSTIYSVRQYFLLHERNHDVETAQKVHVLEFSFHEFSKRYDAHSLDNFCKYAILDPFEPIVLESMLIRNWEEYNTCTKVLPDIVTFQNGFLSVDQQKASEQLNHTVICRYRPFAGTLKPRIAEIVILGPWTFVKDRSDKIFDDQIEVQCYNENGYESELDYQFAFAQVHPYLTEKFEKNTEDLLNINIVVLDSTSLSAFRRHMPKTLRYFRDHMGAMFLEGHIKVADNSLVNLLPLLTGLRYGNQSEGMPSDYPLGVKLEVEKIPLLWNDYRDQNCATFLNVDPANYNRGGLFQYGPTNGLKVKPTTYWYRPWHVYHRKLQKHTYNTTKFCFGNELSYELQLALTEQMTKAYNNTCHFAFTFVTDLSHDDCAFLELIDEQMKNYLHNSMMKSLFNKTVLIIMGDHGQRVSKTRFTFFGRIEERAPLFGIYFPEWFRNKYPRLMKNFHVNRNRLTSHYDVYQVLKDIAEGNFDGYKRNNKIVRQKKGVSLLHNVIPSNRTCKDANIPIQHCACLIPDSNKSPYDDDYSWIYELIINYTHDTLKQYPQCKPVEEIEFKNVSKWTMSQMIQWGVRNLDESDFGYPLLRQGEKIGLVDYYEVEYLMKPFNISALIRLQIDKKNKIKKVNIDPLVKGNFQQCNDLNNSVPKFCIC